MDTDKKSNEEKGCPDEGKEFPFEGFQEMREMMKHCDCRSMMAKMMGPDKSRQAAPKPASEASPKEG